MKSHSSLLALFCLTTLGCAAPPAPSHHGAGARTFTRQDHLRGDITSERAWWDLRHYDLAVEVFPETQSIAGSNEVSFEVLTPHNVMQIDLQEPLQITRVTHEGAELTFEREGAVYWITFPEDLEAGAETSVLIEYAGVPKPSANPPWSGGFTWQKDANGIDFIATSNQGDGASIWWPNKDHDYDEPDDGVLLRVTVPEHLTDVSNGRLVKVQHNRADKTKTFHWRVVNPINSYGVNINVGDYVRFSDTYQGEKGALDCDYWVLRDNLEKARTHFKQAHMTLEAFEHWFGPYPFYEDGYKLVEVPYSGMEHQSSVTYGNGYENGYRGKDVSKTGIGFKFDFIIVHESGHEWFANNITYRDVADMWIHESFTAYSENLFVNYHFSQKEAEDYVIGTRRHIGNRTPLIGPYGVNQAGSHDMYYKGSNMLHTIRQIVNDDEKWRSILRGLNQEFYHQTVTTRQIENYITEKSGVDLSSFFDQYLRDFRVPTLAYKVTGARVAYRFESALDHLAFPVKVRVNGRPRWIEASTQMRVLELDEAIESFEVDRNFYIFSRDLSPNGPRSLAPIASRPKSI
ncbi:MAG: M1 family metallopeptidase, partial [Planctomycetota bacterium]